LPGALAMRSVPYSQAKAAFCRLLELPRRGLRVQVGLILALALTSACNKNDQVCQCIKFVDGGCQLNLICCSSERCADDPGFADSSLDAGSCELYSHPIDYCP
jgi:hypothetical protein